MTDNLSFLGTPYTAMFQPDDMLRDKIAGYFASVLGCKRKEILPELPKTMPRHGKVRIGEHGDTIQCIMRNTGHDHRDASHVRVCNQNKSLAAC